MQQKRTCKLNRLYKTESEMVQNGENVDIEIQAVRGEKIPKAQERNEWNRPMNI